MESAFSSLSPTTIDPSAKRSPAYKKRPKDEERSAQYNAKTPEPNYSEFGKIGVQYVDMKGREYILARGSETVRQYVESGDITVPDFNEPDRQFTENVGTQLLWIRIPIHLRGTVEFPDSNREALTLYFVRDQVLCTGQTDGVFVSGPKKKTGFVVLRNFSTHGQVSDPSKYGHLVSKEKRVKGIVRTLF